MSATVDSLPSRPLKVSELKSLEQSLEFTAPMVIFLRPENSDIYAASLVHEEYVTGIVFEPEAEAWRILDRRERPVPPKVFEDQYRDWAEEYPKLLPLCNYDFHPA